MTLFEVILVIGIASLITVSAVLGLGNLQSSFKVRSAADEIRAQLELGRELSISNQNQASYSISNASGSVVLYSSGVELSRYIPAQGVIFSPEAFDWSFTPITGGLIGCSLPCNLVLTSGNSSETITIYENGVVN